MDKIDLGNESLYHSFLPRNHNDQDGRASYHSLLHKNSLGNFLNTSSRGVNEPKELCCASNNEVNIVYCIIEVRLFGLRIRRVHFYAIIELIKKIHPIRTI